MEWRLYRTFLNSKPSPRFHKKMSIEQPNLSLAESRKSPGEESAEEYGEVESIIQYFLETYRNYIVQCIDYKDLLFYKHFCHKKRREFREKAKLQDERSVTCEMIDYIISLTDVSDRFSALVKLFEDEFENEKVLRILKGEKIPCNSTKNKERIQKMCMKEICENLRVNEIIPDLLRYGLILSREGDHLSKKARQENCFDAALDLVLLLPSRHTNWYPRFLCCLIDSGHQTLAEKVDKDLYEKIILRRDQARLGDNKQTQPFCNDEIIADEFEDMSLVSGPIKNIKSYTEFKSCEKPELVYNSTQESSSTAQDDLIESRSADIHILKRKDSFSSQHENIENRDEMYSATRSQRRSRRSEKSILRWLQESVNYKCEDRAEGMSKVEDSLADANVGLKEWSSRASDFMETSDTVIDDDLSSASTLYEGNTQVLYEGNTENLNLQSNNSDTASDVSDKTEDFHVDADISQKGQKEERLYSTALKPLFNKTNLHPVKLSLILKQYPELLSTCQILVRFSRRSMQLKDEHFALRAHYISTVIQKARDAESIDVWIDKLLTGREIDGYYEFQDVLIRQVVHEFPYKMSPVAKLLKRQLKSSPEGDGLTSLKILIQELNGDSCSADRQRTFEETDEGHVSSSCKLSFKEIRNGAEKDMCDCPNGDAQLESLSGISMEDLQPEGREYQAMAEYLQKTVNGECRHWRVTGIMKIRNKVLYERYRGQKEEIARENNGKVNERFLFHRPKCLRRAIELGFCGTSTENMSQEGIYFADDPLLYLMNECGNCRSQARVPCGGHRLLLCRVSLGDSSSVQQSKIPKGHHSIKIRQRINGTCYRKYIVSGGEQIYPEYLVTFKTIANEDVVREKKQGQKILEKLNR